MSASADSIRGDAKASETARRSAGPQKTRLFPLLAARSRAAMRLTAYLSVVGLGLAAIGVRAAKAEAGRAGLALGRSLLPLVELEAERSTIRLNGQTLYVSSANVEGAPSGVLDRLERECQASADGSANAGGWSEVATGRNAEGRSSGDNPSAGTNANARWSLPRLDVIRREEHGEGVVVCFARRQGTLGDALTRYHETHDLGALGALRYAYAAPAEDGRTRVVATWTDGSFRIDAHLPNGDSEGSDPEVAPRPPHSTRLMSAAAAEMNAGMYAFVTADSPTDTLRFYDEMLTKQQWIALGVPTRSPADASGNRALGEGPRALDATARTYLKDGAQILVKSEREVSGTTTVSVGEVGLRSRER